MTIGELIEKLENLPADWEVWATKSGSLLVEEPAGARYGYVFTDERPNRMLTDKRKAKELDE
jgi:hypothetical protein